MNVKAIDEKYCKGNLVQVMYRDGGITFITSPDEIIFLKRDRKIVINKYANHLNRYEFPYSEDIKRDEFYNCLFEYNKPYITYDVNNIGYSCSLMFFVKDGNRTLMYTTSLPIGLRNTQDVELDLTREEIESRFNKDNYDSMYIIDVDTKGFYINNSKEDIRFGNGFKFSDEAIISRDYTKRKNDYSFNNRGVDISDKASEQIKERTIDEIKNLELYSGFMNKYAHLLLTVKDGVFSLMWFNIVFIEKNKFRLKYSVVPIKVPTKEEVINYANIHDVEYTFEPIDEYSTPEAKDLFDAINYQPGPETTTNQEETPKKDKYRGLIPKWLRDLRKQQ